MFLHAVGGNTFDIFMSFVDHRTTYVQTGDWCNNAHASYTIACCDFADLDGETKAHVIQTITNSELCKTRVNKIYTNCERH